MPNQPWRDIQTRSSLEGRLGKVKHVTEVQYFLNHISSYHALQKDVLKNLAPRSMFLAEIFNTGKSLILENKEVRKDATANYAIVATADQAFAKAKYLGSLIQFYKGAGRRFAQDPKALLEYLSSPSHPAGQLAQLQAACRFEKMDPAHRSFEFDFKRGTNNAIGCNDYTTPMSWALGEWLEIIVSQETYGGSKMPKYGLKFADINTSHLTTPFFLWLEKHPVICLPTPGNAAPWNSRHADTVWKPDASGNIEGESVFYSEYGTSIVKDATAKNRFNNRNVTTDPTGIGAYREYLDTVKPVQATEGIHWLYPSSDGAVFEMPLTRHKKMNRKELKRFDTGYFAGKGDLQPHAAAYVWTACGTLLAGEHVSQKFHHSSFVGGEAVRCAGMIRIDNGKVSQVSNDSGHYQPPQQKLRSFVDWLYQRKVFTNTAQVCYLKMVEGQHKYVLEDVGPFLDPASASSRPDPRIVYALENLAARMKSAAQAYRDTYIDPRTGRKKIFRRTSKASLATEAYLSTDFQTDINEAKKYTGNILWWQVPVKVIKAILGEPGAPNPNQISQEIHNTPDTKRASFSPSIARLQPLKKKSTMHKIIVNQLTGWQEPTTTNPR